MRARSTILAAVPVAVLFASSGAIAQTTGSPATAAQDRADHAATASKTLHDHVEKAEDMVKSLLDLHQAGSTAAQKNTLIAVHRSDLEKLRTELRAIGTDVPASISAVTTRGSMADHIREAKRLSMALNREAADSETGSEPVGTTGDQTGGFKHPDRASTGAVAAAEPSGGHDVVTVDRTKIQELNREIEAIERTAPEH